MVSDLIPSHIEQVFLRFMPNRPTCSSSLVGYFKSLQGTFLIPLVGAVTSVVLCPITWRLQAADQADRAVMR
jgi:hypothetical protein